MNVVVALGLTAIVTFLVWLFSHLFGIRQADLVTAISGLVFFGFCSATMVVRYLRRDVVLAIRPDGYFDARFHEDAVPWEQIKDIRIARQENEFHLNVYLWPNSAEWQPNATAVPTFSSELTPLDQGVTIILEAISTYIDISVENDQQV